MSDTDLEQVRRELDYYKRRVDEVAAENMRLDIAGSALHHQLTQKRQGFALLAALHRSGAVHVPLPDLFQATLREIGATLGMDRSVVLVPTAFPDQYQPHWWLGFRDEAAARFGGLSLQFPSEFAAGTGRLVVNKDAAPTPLVDQLRASFDLPYFICLPVMAHGTPVALLLSGRLKEARPLFPPLDQGDLDTFEAIAGLISASVELERVERLRSFLPPQLAEVIVASGKEALLEHHRREIATVFCDLRGFTAFSETYEPEVVMGVLQEFHAAMGELIAHFQGTLEHIAGDGLMVFFNDPLPIEEPAQQAVRMAVAMRERVRALARTLVQARLRPGLRRGHLPRLRDPGQDRLRGRISLRGDRIGRQSRLAPLRRGAQRSDPCDLARAHRDRRPRERRGGRHAHVEGLPPAGRCLQRAWTEGRRLGRGEPARGIVRQVDPVESVGRAIAPNAAD